MQALIPDLNSKREVHLLIFVPPVWRLLQKALDKDRDAVGARIVVLDGLCNSYEEIIAEAREEGIGYMVSAIILARVACRN